MDVFCVNVLFRIYTDVRPDHLDGRRVLVERGGDSNPRGPRFNNLISFGPILLLFPAFMTIAPLELQGAWRSLLAVRL